MNSYQYWKAKLDKALFLGFILLNSQCGLDCANLTYQVVIHITVIHITYFLPLGTTNDLQN